MDVREHSDDYRNIIVTYDSPAEMADSVADVSEQTHFVAGNFASSSLNGESVTTINAKARNGDDSLVTRAEKLIERFNGAVETSRYQCVPNVVGSRAIVPAMLAGHPLAMLRRERKMSEASPISVALSLSTSAAVSPKVIEEHGCAVLALVMRLVAIRPVDLILFGENRHKNASTNLYTVCRINTTPLELASACYAMTSPAFRRGLRLYLSYKNGMPINGPWAHDYTQDSPAYLAKVKARLALPDGSLIVTGIHAKGIKQSEYDWAQWVEDRYQEALKV